MTSLSEHLAPTDFAIPAAPQTVIGARTSIMTGCARFVLVLLLFSIATILVFRSVVVHPGATLLGPPEDNMQDFWNTWYAAVARSPDHFFFTKLLRFPEGTSLLYQSFAYPQIFAVVVLSRFFGTDMHTLAALQNLSVLASFPLAGTGAFYLVRHFVRSTPAALVGGYVFAFNPSHVAQAMHHAHVSSIEFLPFFALCYLLALDRRSIGWLAAATVFYVLSALSCWYYLFYCAYFMAFQILYLRIRDRAWPGGIWQLLAPALCLAAAAVALSPLVVPMVLATHASVYAPGGNVFVADLAGFVSVPPEHLLSAFSRGIYAQFSGDPWEATVYLGMANLALLVWACRRFGLSRSMPLFYVVLGMIFFGTLACGESLHIVGLGTHVPLPDAALDRLPFFANVRTPSRAVVFVYLFMSIGIGVALSQLLGCRGAWPKGGALALTVAIAVDFLPVHVAATPLGCSGALGVLSADPMHDFGVLNLPWGNADEDAYMLEQTCHRRPMVDGMTTRQMGNALVFRLALADMAEQRAQLRSAHVKYILLHKPRNGLFRWNPELPTADTFRTAYPIVYDGPDMTVLRVY